MKITDERYQPTIPVPEHAYEHWHRYLYALQYAKGKTVLDIACGEGYGSDLLAECATRVVGVDISEEVIKHASSKYIRHNLEYRCGRAGSIPVEGEGVFDVIVSFETIEHLDEDERVRFLAETQRLLTSTGVLLISTPNRLIYSDALNYINKYHLKEFYYDEFIAFLRSAFIHIQILCQQVYPVSYLWSENELAHNVLEYQLAFCDDQFRPVTGNAKQARYFLAVCSNAPLELSLSSSVLIDVGSQAFVQREQTIAALRTHVIECERAAKALQARAAELEHTVQQLNSVIQLQEQRLAEVSARYEGELAERERRLAEVSAHYEGELAAHEQRLAEVSARYEGELAEREQRLAEVSARYEGELAERERRLKRIEAELQQYKRECSGIGYKALRRSRTLFRRFFPDNSVQRALYVVSRRLISRLRAQRRARRNAYPGSLPDTLTMRSCNPAYDQWLLHNVPSVQELKEQRAASLCLSWQPLISVIMPVYNVPTELLTRAIDSVIAQSYPKWELCIVDDCSTDPHVRPLLQRVSRHDRRIRVSFADRNRGIAGASNACMEMARGDFVVFLDNDDELAPHALFFIAELLNRHPDADVIYSDEDKIAPGGTREHPFFKPDFSPDLLLCHNYICHMLVVRRSLVMDVGGFREEYDGAQDYDLILRVVQRTARNRIYHIPDILYHWRMVEGSTALNYWNKPQAKDATLQLIDEYLKNLLGQDYGTVEYVPMADNVLFYPRYALKRFPLVSIVISTRDKVHLLRACIESLSRTTYPSYEIVLIDNNSQEQETKAYFDTLRQEHPHIRIIEYPHPFNYSAINNFGIRQARGEVIILLNNDTELLTPDWIEIMLGYAQQRRVGAVGVKLLYPNGTIQHAGVILGLGGVAGHSHKYYPADHFGYGARLRTVCNYSAVTAACMMFRRDVWQQAGGLDERLAVTFNDVDFCLRIRTLGYDIVYTPQVQLLHHESMSVGRVHLNERTMDAQEIAFMKQRWGEALYIDPFYNLNLTLDTEDYAIHPLRRRQYMATLAKRGRK